MPSIFRYHHTVSPAEIDSLGHVNNVHYIAWLQAAAVAHSTAQGWSPKQYHEAGFAWVVRSHTIEYLRPAWAGDEIIVETWIATMKKVTSLRRYRIYNVENKLLASAGTEWAFVSLENFLPQRIPSEVSSSFQVLEEDIFNTEVDVWEQV